MLEPLVIIHRWIFHEINQPASGRYPHGHGNLNGITSEVASFDLSGILGCGPRSRIIRTSNEFPSQKPPVFGCLFFFGAFRCAMCVAIGFFGFSTLEHIEIPGCLALTTFRVVDFLHGIPLHSTEFRGNMCGASGVLCRPTADDPTINLG